MKHKHAELMALYAQDAMETDKPWERWELRGGSTEWIACVENPEWETAIQYRRKPRTININGHAVPVGRGMRPGEMAVWSAAEGVGRSQVEASDSDANRN